MTHQPQPYKTLPGGAIDYAHYEARMRRIRSLRTRAALRSNWSFLKKCWSLLRNIPNLRAGSVSHAQSNGAIVPAE